MLQRMSALVFAVGLSGAAFAGSEVYGNFETMGVVAECPPGKTPADIGRVRVYIVEGGEKRPVQDAVQVGSESYYASSIFFLEPGRAYRVLVEFYDRAGTKMHSETLSGATRPELKVPAPARRIFVSPSGSDGAAGSEAAPLKTIAAALAKAGPGTAIVLRRGVYYEGDFNLQKSGTAAAPIIITSYEGEEAVMDASAPALLEAGWKKAGEGLFAHAYGGRSNLLALEEKATGRLIRACPMPSLGDLEKRSSAGMSFEKMGIDAAYFCDGAKVTVLTPKPDIKLYRVHAPVRTRAFNIVGRQGIVIDGIGMRFYGKGAYSCAVFAQDSADVTVQRCKVKCCNTGIWLKSDCRRVTVQDNEFGDDLLRWHFGYIKSRGVNYHSQIESGCVYCDGRYAGRGLVVRHNRIEGLFDGAHMASDSNASRARGQKYRTHETDFYRNEIVGVCDDFIEVDGYARNVRVFDNVMTNCLSGISIAQALDGPTWAIYNTICGFGVATGATLESYEGYPVKSNGGLNTQVGSGHVFFYHNTSWTPNRRDSAFLVKSAKWRKITFRNNIWHGQSGGFNSWRATLSPVDMKSDVVYSPAGYQVKIGRATSGPGDKGNGVVLNFSKIDPALKNPMKRDYTLSPGSGCIDRGVPVPGVNDGRTRGERPDIGFHEAGLAQPRFGPRTSKEPGEKGKAPAARPEEPGGGPAAGRTDNQVAGWLKMLRDGRGAEAAAAIEAFKARADLTPEADAAYELLKAACTAPARLRPEIVKAVAEGRRLRVYVMVAGRRMRGRVASADAKGIKAVVRGGEMPLPWGKLGIDELARIGRQLVPARKSATRDVVLLLAALGDEDRARDVQARSRDAELGRDLGALVKLMGPRER